MSLFFLLDNVPAVDFVRKSLDAAEEKWFIWLLISSGIVAIGCILEIGETWSSLVRWCRIRKGVAVEDEDLRSWHVPAGAIGLVLVIIGVIGEVVFEGLVSSADTHLRGHDEQVLADAIQRAGSAKDSAEKAATAAGTAKKSAEAAGIQAAAAGTTAGNAAKVASDANDSAKAVGTKADKLESELTVTQSSLIAANTQLGEVEKRRKQLEAYLHNVAVCTAPRVIPEWYAYGKGYVDPLKSLKGFKAKLVVFADPEAIEAASTLKRVLSAVGVDVISVAGQPNESIPPGVQVESFGLANAQDVFPPPSDESSRNAALTLVKFLHSYNWQARWLDGFSSHTADLAPDSIRIAVGRYPPPELVTPPAMEELEITKAENERLSNAQFEAEINRAFNERIKDLPPEKAEAAKHEHESWHRKMEVGRKESMEQYGDVQPCQPMKASTP